MCEYSSPTVKKGSYDQLILAQLIIWTLKIRDIQMKQLLKELVEQTDRIAINEKNGDYTIQVYFPQILIASPC